MMNVFTWFCIAVLAVGATTIFGLYIKDLIKFLNRKG